MPAQLRDAGRRSSLETEELSHFSTADFESYFRGELEADPAILIERHAVVCWACRRRLVERAMTIGRHPSVLIDSKRGSVDRRSAAKRTSRI